MDYDGRRRILWAGGVLGFGLSGLFDLVVFHLLLQWHHFIARGPLEQQLRSDGYLGLALLLVVLIGVAMAWRARHHEGQAGGRTLVGAALIGAGVFNAVDLLVDHFLLDLHQTRMGADTLAPELGWAALSLVPLALGWAIVRSQRRGG